MVERIKENHDGLKAHDDMMKLSVDNMGAFFDHMKKQDDINGKISIFMESSNKSTNSLLDMILSLQSQIGSS